MRLNVLLSLLVITSFYSFAQVSEKGIALDVNTGYSFKSKWTQELVGVHYRFNKNFSLGFTSGVYIPSEGAVTIPFLVDARGYYHIKDTKLTAMAVARGGCYLNTDHVKFKTFGFEIMPGLQYSITDKFAVQLLVGYEMIFNTEAGVDGNGIPIQAGINFKF